MRLATAIKKKIIPHICQPSPRNASGSEVAELSDHGFQSAYIQSAQQLASGSRRSPLFPISETARAALVAGQLQNSRHCSLEGDR